MKYSHCTLLSIAFIIYSVHARASECLQCTGLLQGNAFRPPNLYFNFLTVERPREWLGSWEATLCGHHIGGECLALNANPFFVTNRVQFDKYHHLFWYRLHA